MKIVRLFLLGFVGFFLSLTAMAKTLTLYEQPKADSKVVGTIDSDHGIITIYTPKDVGFVKVADPRNGNVGWVKTSDMIGVGYNFNVMSTGDKNGYHVIQFGGNMPYTQEDIKKAMQQFELRNQQLQKDAERMMKDLFNNMPFPIIVPMMVMPGAQQADHPPASQNGNQNQATEKKNN